MSFTEVKRILQFLRAFMYIFYCYWMTSKLKSNFKRFIKHCATFQYTNLCTSLEKRPDPLYSPSSLLFNSHRVSFPGVNGRNVMLTTHLPLVWRWGVSGVILLLLLFVLMAWEGTDSSYTVDEFNVNFHFESKFLKYMNSHALVQRLTITGGGGGCRAFLYIYIYIYIYIYPFIVPPVLLQTISTLRSLLMACTKSSQWFFSY